MAAIAIDPPLTRWYCDKCHLPIEDPQMAVVCWRDPTSSTLVNDRLQHVPPERIYIFHKVTCDNPGALPSNQGLDLMLGAEGMQWWASFLWRGPVAEPMNFAPSTDFQPVMELFYRLHVPHYEQARRQFKSKEAIQDLKGLPVLTESVLKAIIVRAAD